MKTKSSKSWVWPLLGVALLAVSAAPARSATLVYEGFNYTQADNANMQGVTVNATGLTGTYGTTPAAAGGVPFQYDTTGLTFGSNFFSTVGGSVLTVTAGNYSILGAQLNTGTVTGNLYQSYLVSLAAPLNAPVAGDWAGARINDVQAGSTGSRFSLQAEGNTAGYAVGVGYDGSATANVTAGNGALSTGTTYLMLGKFTNVGNSLSVGSPGTAKLWAFTQTAYDNWYNAGSSEGALDTYATYNATDSNVTSGTYTFDNSDFFQFAATSFTTGATGRLTVNFDELRFGTELKDVVLVVPEPSAWLLVASGLGGFLLSRRRR